MVIGTSGNSHFDYLDVTRHWCAKSEPYAGGDGLVTFLNDGWKMENTVYEEIYWHAGVRQIKIIHFDLRRGEESFTLPVLINPYIRRLLASLPIQVKSLQDRQAKPARTDGEIA